MIRKSLLCLCLIGVAACGKRAAGPDVDLTMAAIGESRSLSTPEVSPDGTRLAYTMAIEGKSAIYVADADGSKPVRLTFGVWDAAPIWSPNGQWIAYYSDHNADVWLVPAAGGESRQLTSGPAFDGPLGWLPDGSGVILIRRGVGDDQTLVAPLDSGPVRPLFAAPAGNVAAFPSPDGSKVAFILNRGGRGTIWVQDTTGSARQLTTEGFEGARLNRMWSPDGRLLLFTSSRSGTGDLWSADVQTGELQQLTNDIRNDGEGAWSPDGRWIVFSSDRGGQDDLWIVAATGGTAHRVTNDISGEQGASWSSDGRSISYASRHTATSIDVVAAAGGTPPRTLVPLDGYSAFGLALSPDGQTVLFTSNRSGDADIWSVPMAGGEPTPFATSPVFDGQAAWSPDGKWVSFTSSRSGGTADIWVMPAAGGAARQLTDWPSNEGNPRWSPDGATIAFASNRDATQAEVWTIPAAGGAATRITRGNVSAGDVRWAPDGHTLFYTGAAADGSRQLFRVPAAGGTPRVLTHAKGGASIAASTVSPDGATLAYSYLEAGLAFLEVVPSAGGVARRFTTDRALAYQIGAAWAPDGSQIVFSDWSYETLSASLTAVSFPEGTTRPVTTTTDALEFNAFWTPDGQTLVFASDRSTTRAMSANVSRLLAAAKP